MKNNHWSINKTSTFSEIEKVDVVMQKIDEENIQVSLDDSTYTAKKQTTWKFLLKRYPLMLIATTLLSIMFLAIHPLSFVIYLGLIILLFTVTVRRCKIRYIGTYIMWFWILHLGINFIILGGGSLFSFAMATSESYHYIQSLFFGMVLVHLWQYILIVVYEYYHLYVITEEYDDGSVDVTEWYIWKSCSLCNKSFNPFKNNCKLVK